MPGELLARLDQVIRAAVPTVVGVRIGDPANKATWTVDPSNLQASAQPTIDAFDTSQAAQDAWNAQQSGKTVGRITPVRIGVDRVNSTVNLADVTGLSFQLAANSHYAFSFIGAYTAAAGTTGLQLAVNGPASPALIRMVATIAESATATRQGAAGAYDTPVNGTASGGATALPFYIDGNISTGATAGMFTLRFRSEVGGSAVTILSGSYGLLYGIG